MCARREAGAFVEQVLDGGTRFDRQDIDEGFGESSAEIQPQPVGQRAMAGAAWNFQEWVADPRLILRWPATQPCFFSSHRLHSRRALGPFLQAGASGGGG